MWYECEKTLTHNCLFNIIIGNRGCGKTYGLKKRGVKNFLKDKSQFVYLRRYDSELDLVKDNLYNDIVANEEFPDREITYKNGCYYLDNEIMGYAMALTKSSYFKSASFPRVKLIIFDECMIDDSGTSHYLPNEVMKFLDFYETIARKRDVLVFFLSNAISFINPYTVYWDLHMPYGKDIVKKEDLVLLQLVMNEEFIQEKEQTRFGRLIKGTTYGDYAINNKFLKDSKEFIAKKTGNCDYVFTFTYKGEFYGVWISYSQGRMYVSNDVDGSCKVLYSLTLEDHTDNTMLLKNINKSVYFKQFIDNYKLGVVYFENQRIKNVVYEVIKKCIN